MHRKTFWACLWNTMYRSTTGWPKTNVWLSVSSQCLNQFAQFIIIYAIYEYSTCSQNWWLYTISSRAVVRSIALATLCTKDLGSWQCAITVAYHNASQFKWRIHITVTYCSCRTVALIELETLSAFQRVKKVSTDASWAGLVTDCRNRSPCWRRTRL